MKISDDCTETKFKKKKLTLGQERGNYRTARTDLKTSEIAVRMVDPNPIGLASL